MKNRMTEKREDLFEEEKKGELFDEGLSSSDDDDDLDFMEEQEEPLDFSVRRSPRETLEERSRSPAYSLFQVVPVHSTTGMPVRNASIPSMQTDGMNQYLESNRNYLVGEDYSEDSLASAQDLSDGRRRAPPPPPVERDPYYIDRLICSNAIFDSEEYENSAARLRNISGETNSNVDDNPTINLPADMRLTLKTGYNCCILVNGERHCRGRAYRDLCARHFGQRMQSHLEQRNRSLPEENTASEFGPPSDILNDLNLSSSPPLPLEPPPVLGEEAMATVHRYMIHCMSMSRQDPVPPQFRSTLNLYDAVFGARTQDSQQASGSVNPPASNHQGPMAFPSGGQAAINFPSTSQGVPSIPPTSQVQMNFPSTSQGLMSFPSSSQGALNMSSSPGPIGFPSTSPGPIGFPSTSPGPLSFPSTSQGPLSFPSTSQGPLSFPSTSQGPFPSTSSGLTMLPSEIHQPILSMLQASNFFSGDGSLEKSPTYAHFRQNYLRRRNLSSKPRRGNRDRSFDGQESDQDGHRRRDSDDGAGPESSGAEGSDRLGDASRDDENNNGMRLDKNGNPRDAAYWERRRRNNQAAKRSRDAKRNRELENEIQLEFLKWLLLPNLYRMMGNGNNNNNNNRQQ